MLINMVSLTELSYRFLSDMAQQKSGTLINIVSATSFIPLPCFAVYDVTKAYLLSFTKKSAMNTKKVGIHILAVPIRHRHISLIIPAQLHKNAYTRSRGILNT